MVKLHNKKGCDLQQKWGFLGIMTAHPWLREGRNRDIICAKEWITMKDIPVFTTDWGVSSLVLKEIPYRQEAYIHIQDVQPGGLVPHLEECAGFCRMAGAENIFVRGEGLQEKWPLHCRVLRMCGEAHVEPEKLRCLFPVTEQTVGHWRKLCNERLRNVDNAATLESRDEKRILQSGGAYFIHDSGRLLGIGWLEDTKLLVMAAVEPGAGELVMHTLMSVVEGARMELEVASTNARAIRLYEKLGFIATGEISAWYRVR